MKHYVYRHRRLDTNEIFYIGLGTKTKKDKNAFTRAYTKNGRNLFWYKIVAKTDYKVEILCRSEEYEDMKELEHFLISLYGRRDLGKGTLCNLTDGGDGSLGRIMKETTKNKIIKAKTGIKMKWTRHIDTRGENHHFFGKNHTQETKDKISKKNKGRVYSEQALINMKEGHKNAPKGAENKNSKKIINTQTLEIYASKEEIHQYLDVTLKTISVYLNRNSNSKNPTYFMYLEDYEKYGADEPHIKNPFYKKVIDTESNIEYSSMKECSRILNIDYSSLKAMLSNKKENITTLIYQKDL